MILGIDIGTTTICAVQTADDGAFLHSDTLSGAPMETAHTQNPDTILAQAQSLAAAAPDVRAVAVTGQMHGILYLDAAGNAVSPLYTWQNEFGNRQRGSETYAEYVSCLTGYPASSGFGLVTHLYLTENGLLPVDAACLCTIGDYVAMKLAHRSRPLLHASNAASLGVFDLRRLDFDNEALSRLSIDRELLPAVTSVLTAYDGRVFTAIGDNQASFRGSVTNPSRELLINIGTGGQLSCMEPAYRAAEHCETRPYDGGAYLLVASSLCGGRAYVVLERFFRDILGAFGTELSDDAVYEGMSRILAAYMPNAAPMVADTTLSGTRENPSLRGEVTGISPDNFTPGGIIDAFLHGIAAEFLPAYEALCRIRSFSALSLSGNAIRRNPYLRDIFAKTYRLPLSPHIHTEEAAYGAALLAADYVKL
ncbi:MAG: FGGY family carbohydrate kinase [Clostridiaceae bacterium]|nr:FGGY family carbohydrate kinase [Clostridiaceae bacterium]